MALTPSLRRASDRDIEWLYSIHVLTMRDAIAATWGWDERRQRREFEERRRRCAIWIAAADGRDAGSVWLQTSRRYAYVANLYVVPDLQGRGIATAVLTEVIAAAARSAARVELSLLAVNGGARRLYERLGFVVSGEQPPFVRMRLDPPPEAAWQVDLRSQAFRDWLARATAGGGPSTS